MSDTVETLNKVETVDTVETVDKQEEETLSVNDNEDSKDLVDGWLYQIPYLFSSRKRGFLQLPSPNEIAGGTVLW